jgi:hypothetical protein
LKRTNLFEEDHVNYMVSFTHSWSPSTQRCPKPGQPPPHVCQNRPKDATIFEGRHRANMAFFVCYGILRERHPCLVPLPFRGGG